LKSGSLNLLEPSGPVQACNGIALPFFLMYLMDVCYQKNTCLVRRQSSYEASD